MDANGGNYKYHNLHSKLSIRFNLRQIVIEESRFFMRNMEMFANKLFFESVKFISLFLKEINTWVQCNNRTWRRLIDFFIYIAQSL